MQGMMMGQGGERMQDMQTIHTLFAEHQKITRTVKNIGNGVEALTESEDPKVQALIAEHAWAMQKRLADKQPIRAWDPLFAELFKYSDKIKFEVTKTPKGVKVVETSTDPYVVKLLQAHAAGVSEFVKEGSSSMHKTHPLPGAPVEEKKFLGRGDGITTCPVTGEPVNKNVSAEINGRTVYFCCASCRDAVIKNPELYLKPEKR
jgi:YHS domain-containing protein/acylphosphatase